MYLSLGAVGMECIPHPCLSFLSTTMSSLTSSLLTPYNLSFGLGAASTSYLLSMALAAQPSKALDASKALPTEAPKAPTSIPDSKTGMSRVMQQHQSALRRGPTVHLDSRDGSSSPSSLGIPRSPNAAFTHLNALGHPYTAPVITVQRSASDVTQQSIADARKPRQPRFRARTSSSPVFPDHQEFHMLFGKVD